LSGPGSRADQRHHRPRRGSRRARPWPSSSLATVLAAIAVLAAACSTPAARVSIPPDATGSVGPVATGSPAASAATVPSPVGGAAAAFPLSLTDDEGTTVELAERPERIVSLTPAATETLFALGAGDRVVGKVEDIAAHPPEAADIPVVATFQGVDIERIVELESDLVIAGGLGFTPPDAVEQLRRVEIPVLVLYAESTDAAFGGIELIGDAVGEAAPARDLTASMRAQFDQVEAATSSLARPRVFYEIDATSKIYTPAEGSVYAEMLRLAGSAPILTDESYEISLEEIVEADPELILLGNPVATPEEVADRPGWGGITAVEQNAIVQVDDTIITRPGPRLVEGLRQLAKAIHPELELPVPSADAVPDASAPAPSASATG
jgi:iron complex transport system substrate-binding protein